MLLRITNACHECCPHCFIDASPDGSHISRRVFVLSVIFMLNNNVNAVLVSGGEPTLHPELEKMTRALCKQFQCVMLASNGSFAFDDVKFNTVSSLLDKHQNLLVQVRTEKGLYASYDKIINNERIKSLPRCEIIEGDIRMIALGRQKENHRSLPTCSNFWSAAQNDFLNFKQSISFLESKYKFCTPSIDIDGSVRMGETPFCLKIGTVDGQIDDLHSVKPCNKCGLGKNLEDKWNNLRGSR